MGDRWVYSLTHESPKKLTSIWSECWCSVTILPSSPTPDPEPSQPSAMPAAEEPEPARKDEPEWLPEATFVLQPEPNAECVQECEPASVSVIEGILVEFVGIDWNLPTLPVELLYDELDYDMMLPDLLSPLVPSSTNSSSLLDKPSSKSSSSMLVKHSSKSSSTPLY